MKKVAVFGNAGGGKSTLAKAVAARLQLPLFALDKICYYAGGGAVPPEIYLKRHEDILARSEWVLDGYGSIDTVWKRLSVADTLVFIDLPLSLHFWWVTKRFFKGLFVQPEGWPEGSPMLSSTLRAYRVLWLCHRRLTPKYRAHVLTAAATKDVFHLRSRSEIADFLANLHPWNLRRSVPVSRYTACFARGTRDEQSFVESTQKLRSHRVPAIAGVSRCHPGSRRQALCRHSLIQMLGKMAFKPELPATKAVRRNESDMAATSRNLQRHLR